MKITDMIISAVLKKGIVYEARNVDTVFTIPKTKADEKNDIGEIRINFKADHMTLKIEKSEGEA